MLLLVLAASVVASAPPRTEAERQAWVARSSREELAAFLRTTPPDVLLALSERAITTLGTYTYVMAKRERVRGTLLDEQVIRVTAREKPFATRLDYLSGPNHGRIVIYNSAASVDQFRVREGGLLNAAGPLWVPVDSFMAKVDSNHTVKEAGLGNLIARLRREMQRAVPLGALRITNEGWNDAGQFCQLHVMPSGGKGFDYAQTRVCVDLGAGIPARVESYDSEGTLLERYAFSELKGAKVPDSAFDPSQPF